MRLETYAGVVVAGALRRRAAEEEFWGGRELVLCGLLVAVLPEVLPDDLLVFPDP